MGTDSERRMKEYKFSATIIIPTNHRIYINAVVRIAPNNRTLRPKPKNQTSPLIFLHFSRLGNSPIAILSDGLEFQNKIWEEPAGSRTHDSRLLAELQLNSQMPTSYHNHLTKSTQNPSFAKLNAFFSFILSNDRGRLTTPGEWPLALLNGDRLPGYSKLKRNKNCSYWVLFSELI